MLARAMHHQRRRHVWPCRRAVYAVQCQALAAGSSATGAAPTRRARVLHDGGTARWSSRTCRVSCAAAALRSRLCVRACFCRHRASPCLRWGMYVQSNSTIGGPLGGTGMSFSTTAGLGSSYPVRSSMAAGDTTMDLADSLAPTTPVRGSAMRSSGGLASPLHASPSRGDAVQRGREKYFRTGIWQCDMCRKTQVRVCRALSCRNGWD